MKAVKKWAVNCGTLVGIFVKFDCVNRLSIPRSIGRNLVQRGKSAGVLIRKQSPNRIHGFLVTNKDQLRVGQPR
jgi:hypothetical protein